MNTNTTFKNRIKSSYSRLALLGFGCLIVFAYFLANGFVIQSLQSSIVLSTDAASGNAPAEQEAVKRQAKESFLKLPLMFEANKGQIDSEVKFFSRGAGYNLFLTPTEAVISLHKQTQNSEKTENETAVLQMKLTDANANAKVSVEKELPGKVNYLIGNDKEKWQTDVQTFGRVKYAAVYPGVDLVYYGKQRDLEYDFVVAPNADPDQINLEFSGADKIEIGAEGDLILPAGDDEVRFKKPFTYQETGGERQEIASRYVFTDKDKIGFKLRNMTKTNRSLLTLCRFIRLISAAIQPKVEDS